ncbi:MAG: MFS transporter [Magnetospirillum sp.]|nr:MFS transporter [Magnetospirillum sp.]
MTPRSAGLRLSTYYIAVFTAVGIHLPFWPVWLADKGMTAAQIGIISAITYLSRIVINPIMGHLVDRRGDRRRPMIALATAATLAFLMFSLVDGFIPILIVTALAIGLWAAIMPVGESLAMMTVHHHRLDYGRVRLWGSLAFIAAATLCGRLLTGVPPGVLVWLIGAAMGLTALICVALPDLRATPPGGTPAPFRPLLVSVPFLLFLATGSFNNAAHTVYYGFATLHWRAAGIGDDVIGLLWSEGVVAEIVLFAFSGPVVRRLGPGGLLLIAALCGVVRWLALGATTALPALAVIQVLHAATFGCAHLGAMHFLQRAIPTGLSARAQGLYASVAVGLAPGLMSPLTGWLYQTLGGGAYAVMAALSLGAAATAWLLMKRWDGGSALS